MRGRVPAGAAAPSSTQRHHTLPTRHKLAKKLVSHDEHTKEYNYKYSFFAEVVPLCKDDLVLLPKRVANSMGARAQTTWSVAALRGSLISRATRCAGSMGRLGLVSRVSNIIQLLDPTTLRCGELGPSKYWKLPFRGIASSSNLVEYIVIDVEVVRVRRGTDSRHHHGLHCWSWGLCCCLCGGCPCHCHRYLPCCSPLLPPALER